MTRKLHIVFPKEYMDVLLRSLDKEKYTVINKEYSLDTFHHWATGEDLAKPDIALIVETTDSDIPVERLAKEYIDKLTEIRLNPLRQEIRLILVLPSQFGRITYFKKSLAALAIYDVYFTEEFSFDTIIEWIDNEKTLADVKDLFVSSKEEQNQIILEDKESAEVSTAEKNDTRVGKKENIKRVKESFSKEKGSLKREKSEIVKEVIVEKVIEKYITIAQQSIAFISLSKGAGSTFHTLNFASYLKGKDFSIGVYEQPQYNDGRTYIADVFNIFQWEEDANISVPHAILEKTPIIFDQVYKYQDIPLYAVDYSRGDITKFTIEQTLRYLNTGKHSMKIMDFGYLIKEQFEDDKFWNILNIFDHVIVVADTMPIALIPNMERLNYFQKLEEKNTSDVSVHFLLNRISSKMANKDLHELGFKNAIKCNALDQDSIYKAYFDMKIPYDTEQILRDELSLVYENLCHDMGIEIGSNKRRKKRLFGWKRK